MTSAKKSWNSGVISSCLYLQDSYLKSLDLAASKAKEVYDSVVNGKSSPSESHEEVHSSENSSDDES